MENNSANETVDLYPRNENLAKVEIGILIIIFVVSTLSNCLVLIALFSKKRRRGRKALPRMYYFIFHLCLADLINAFFNTLPQLLWDITYRFKGGKILCKAVKYGQILGPYLSSYILMATALDRYRAICYPLTYHIWSFRRSRISVAHAWCFSIIFSIPQLFIFSYQEVAPGILDCWATFFRPWGEQAYVVWYSVSIFFIPLLCLIFTYTFICRVIWSNGLIDLNNHDRLISRAKINTIKQTIAVIAAYVICSLPFIAAELWGVWDPSAYEKVWSLIYNIGSLSSLNSCANPWIFLIFNFDLLLSLRIFLERKIFSSKIWFRNSTTNCSFTPGDSQKKTLRKKYLNWGSLIFSRKRKHHERLDLKSKSSNAEENGITPTIEIITLNYTKE